MREKDEREQKMRHERTGKRIEVYVGLIKETLNKMTNNTFVTKRE